MFSSITIRLPDELPDELAAELTTELVALVDRWAAAHGERLPALRVVDEQ